MKNSLVTIEDFLKNHGRLETNMEIYNGNGDFIGFYHSYDNKLKVHVCRKHISTIFNITETLHFVKVNNK